MSPRTPTAHNTSTARAPRAQLSPSLADKPHARAESNEAARGIDYEETDLAEGARLKRVRA